MQLFLKLLKRLSYLENPSEESYGRAVDALNQGFDDCEAVCIQHPSKVSPEIPANDPLGAHSEIPQRDHLDNSIGAPIKSILDSSSKSFLRFFF